MISTVLKVTSVKVSICRAGHESTLTVKAEGAVPSTGWTDAQLSPCVYVVAPEDGIYDFHFVANRPDQSSPVITPIAVEYNDPAYPKDLRGARVRASTNSMTGLLFERGAGAVVVRGRLTNEGVMCQTLRTEDDELYTLIGDLGGFTIGDEVIVAGTIAEVSVCMQGTTIAVTWIDKQATKAAPAPAI